MEIKFSNVLPTSTYCIADLKPGQCFIGAKGMVFTRTKAIDGKRPSYGGREVEAIAIDGSNHYTAVVTTFEEVYEIESITLRRVK